MGSNRRNVIFCEGETELKLIRGLIKDGNIVGFSVSDVKLFGQWNKLSRAHVFMPDVSKFYFIKDTDDLIRHRRNIADAKKSNHKLEILYNDPNVDFLILEMLGKTAKTHSDCLKQIEKICGSKKNNDYNVIKQKGGELKKVVNIKNFEIFKIIK